MTNQIIEVSESDDVSPNTSSQFKDAKTLYNSYKKTATKQSVLQNLEILWTVLNDIFNDGLRDYSLAEVGRRLEKANGPKTQSLRNAAGAPYREIISAFALAAEGATRYVSKSKSTVEQALDMVTDPSARAVLRSALNDAKRLKVVNDNLHTAFKKLSVGANLAKVASIQLDDTSSNDVVLEGVVEVLDAVDGMQSSIGENSAKSLTGGVILSAKDKLILKRSLDPARLAQNGIKIADNGSIVNDQGDVLFPSGFVSAIFNLYN